jgi:hypothetical protein
MLHASCTPQVKEFLYFWVVVANADPPPASAVSPVRGYLAR